MKKTKSDISIKPFKVGRKTAFQVNLIGENGGGVKTCLNRREMNRLAIAVRNTLLKRLHELEVKGLSNGINHSEWVEARTLSKILKVR